MIKISSLADLVKHEEYIKSSCPDIKSVLCTAIYFIDKSNPSSSGVSISFHGYPEEMNIYTQYIVLKAINAACNTDFDLEA